MKLQIEVNLGTGVIEEKIHCSVLAEDAIKAALADFQGKRVEQEGVMGR